VKARVVVFPENLIRVVRPENPIRDVDEPARADSGGSEGASR